MTHGDVLGAFQRSLALEAHNVARDPTLLFQQLQNRLQWEGEEVRARLRPGANGGAPRRRAVIRLKTQQRESRALALTIGAHAGAVNDCAIGVGGAYIVSVGDDGAARQWDRQTGREIRSVPIAPGGSGGYHHVRLGAMCCAVSPDGELIVAGGGAGSVKAWDPASGIEAWSVAESAYTVNACAVTPDAGTVLWLRAEQAGRLSCDDVLRIRDRDGGERNVAVSGDVMSCAVSPDGRLLAVAIYEGMTGRVEVRSLRTGAELWTGKHPPTAAYEVGDGAAGFPPRIHDCAFSPDGTVLVTAGEDAKLMLWNPRAGVAQQALGPTPGGRQTACAVLPDGSAILAGSRGGALTLWDVAAQARITTLEGHGDEVTACSVAADGSFAASASRDGTVRIWDMDLAREGG